MAPTSKMALGIKRASRSHTYHRRGLWAIKAKHGGAFPKAEKPAAVAEPKFYPADDVKPRTVSTRKPHPTKLRSVPPRFSGNSARLASSSPDPVRSFTARSIRLLQIDHHTGHGADPARGEVHGEARGVPQAAQVWPAPHHW